MDRVSNVSGNYVISGTSTLQISSSSNIVVPVSAKVILTRLSGTVSFNGVPSAFATVEIEDGSYHNVTVSNLTGFYSFLVPSGSYNVYAYSNVSGSAVFSKVSVIPFVSSYLMNITLQPSYSVSYWVQINGKIVNTNMTISTNTTSFVFSTSSGKAFLPSGYYNFTASVNRTETNGTGQQITVPYSSSYYTFINSARDIGIDLTISNQYQFNFSQITNSKSVAINSSLNYTFRVFNSGYVTTNLTFSTGNSSWNMTFTPGYASLMPGIGKLINVTIKVPSNATAGFTQIPVTLSYNSYQITEYLNLTVNPYVNFTMSSINTFATPSNRSLLVPFQIKNTGNTPVNVLLSFNSSQRSLIRSVALWNVNFTYQGKVVTNVTVPVSSQITVYVLMNASGSGPKSVSNITVYGEAQGGTPASTLYLHPSYMSAPVVLPYPKGNSIISNYTGSPYDSLIIGLVIIAAAVLVGLIAASARGRKNR